MNTMEIFKKICDIPHCSHETEALKEFIKDFCIKSGCLVEIDSAGNILARKNEPEICLQSHYDMVCIGDAPNIKVYEEDGFLKAKNSSLGADNGIGVAMMLSLSQKVENIELLFTNDEEVGLIGANNLSLKVKSKKVLNLDSEEFGKVYIGCAGGVDVKAVKNFKREKTACKDIFKISLFGLPGGHSGVDIDKNIPNAIKEMALFLSKFYPKIISIKGGEALNSIPKSIEVVVSTDKPIPADERFKVEKLSGYQDMYVVEESHLIIDTLCAIPDGVRGYDKSFSIPSISQNLSKIQTLDDTIIVELFIRANDNNFLEKMKKEVLSFFSIAGFIVKFSNQFSGWKPEINEFSEEVFELYKKSCKTVTYSAIHAGLECGVLLDKMGGNKLMASIGPNIYNPHSINEKCEIKSVKEIEKIIENLVR